MHSNLIIRGSFGESPRYCNDLWMFGREITYWRVISMHHDGGLDLINRLFIKDAINASKIYPALRSTVLQNWNEFAHERFCRISIPCTRIQLVCILHPNITRSMRMQCKLITIQLKPVQRKFDISVNFDSMRCNSSLIVVLHHSFQLFAAQFFQRLSYFLLKFG